MNPAASQRAGVRLLALLNAPSCRHLERRCFQRATALNQKRCISSASRRFQEAAVAPAASTSQTIPQSSSRDRLRTLESSADPEPRSLTDQLSDPPPFLGEEERQVDWTRSYHGLSSSPFTTEQADILMRQIDFDDIEIKPDGIIYLPEIKYRRILNRAFGPGGWGLAPRGETIVTGKIVTREYGLVCGGRYVCTITA